MSVEAHCKVQAVRFSFPFVFQAEGRSWQLPRPCRRGLAPSQNACLVTLPGAQCIAGETLTERFASWKLQACNPFVR